MMNNKYPPKDATKSTFIVEHIVYYEGYRYCSYVPLRPTGKWKLSRCQDGSYEILIQHKDFLFLKSWIHEEDIVYCALKTEFVYDCREPV